MTETPQDTYKSDPSLGSILLRSAGIYIRYAATTIAQFLSSGLTLFSSTGYKLAEFLSTGVNLYANDESNHKLAEFNTGGMSVYNGSGTEIAHLGYGPGTSSTGETYNAPYVTLGTRKSNSTKGNYSVAEGIDTTASGYTSHAEGYDSEAEGRQSHAEGSGTWAYEVASHAEGLGTVAKGQGAHAEGQGTEAEGNLSHAEGFGTKAIGFTSHAQGQYCRATGEASFASGQGTVAQGFAQTAIGRYNVAQGNADSWQNSDYAFIIGRGSSDNMRSNAFAVTYSGNVSMVGDLQNMSGTTLLSSAGKAVSAGTADTATTANGLSSSAVLSTSNLPKGTSDYVLIGNGTSSSPSWKSKVPIGAIPTGTSSTTVAKGDHGHSGYVPTSRTINGHSLTGNITLDASDIDGVAAKGNAISDLNSITNSGIYAFTTSASNRPNSSYSAGMVIMAYIDSSSAYQIAVQRSGSGGVPYLFARSKVSGSWKEWKEF